MTNQTPSLPPAGWLPDVNAPGQNRWWDGTAWTEHVTPSTPPTAETPAPANVTLNGPGYNPYNAGRDLSASKNTAATTGLILALIALIVNPVLLPGIGGLVWGIVGLVRANKWAEQGHPPIGKTKAIWAIVLASLATLGSMALKGFLF